MDFTFLFIVVLMVLAAKSGLLLVAGGLFLLLLISALKSHWLLFAAVLGGIVTALVALFDLGEETFWPIVGGLFLVMLIIVKKETDHPTPEYGGYG